MFSYDPVPRLPVEILTAIYNQKTNYLLELFSNHFNKSPQLISKQLEPAIYKKALFYLALQDDENMPLVTQLLIRNVFKSDTTFLAVEEAVKLAANSGNQTFIKVVLEESGSSLVKKLLINADLELFRSLLNAGPGLRQFADNLPVLLHHALKEHSIEAKAEISKHYPNLLELLESRNEEEALKLLEEAIKKNDFVILQILLEHCPVLFQKKEINVWRQLFVTAVSSNNLGLVMVLLKNNPPFLAVTLPNSYRPIVLAAKLMRWDTVAAIAAEYSNKLADSDPAQSFRFLLHDVLKADFHKALLLALRAKMPIEVIKQFDLNSVCTSSVCFKEGNILHHAMRNKNSTDSISYIFTTLQNKDLLSKLVCTRNKDGKTAIELAATESNWRAVVLHTQIYSPKNKEDIELYKKVLSQAIRDRNDPALKAAWELIAAIKKSDISFSRNIPQITDQIHATIVGQSANNLLINQVFSSLLTLAETQAERIEILTDLAKRSQRTSEKREGYDISDQGLMNVSNPMIKNNIIDLISQLDCPELKIEMLLSFLEDKSNIIWSKDGLFTPALLDGTREKLIHVLIKEFAKLDRSCDLQKTAAFITKSREIFDNNSVDIKSPLNIQLMIELGRALLKLLMQPNGSQFYAMVQPMIDRCPTVIELSKSNWLDAATINMIKDFLLVITDQDPLFLQEMATPHLQVIKDAIVDMYENYIKKNKILQRCFLFNLSKQEKSGSVIFIVLKDMAKKDLDSLSENLSEVSAPCQGGFSPRSAPYSVGFLGGRRSHGNNDNQISPSDVPLPSSRPPS